ncbi:hypothetical protein [Runella sp.]|uniref:hypothetical protein n=1 Tax=Runella sp. TaxID=1960881 RepID=UPI003D112161
MEQTIAKIGFAEVTQETQRFINRNWLIVGILNLVAAIGRFVQEGGTGRISAEAFLTLEIAVELSRILLVLLVIGNGSVANGFRAVISVFRMKRADWKQVWNNVRTNVAWNKITLSINFIIFMVIGTAANISIDLFTHLFLLEWLKSHDLLVVTASQWPVILFLKNISIIPFTLVFECVLVLILIGKLKP